MFVGFVAAPLTTVNTPVAGLKLQPWPDPADPVTFAKSPEGEAAGREAPAPGPCDADSSASIVWARIEFRTTVASGNVWLAGGVTSRSKLRVSGPCPDRRP